MSFWKNKKIYKKRRRRKARKERRGEGGKKKAKKNKIVKENRMTIFVHKFVRIKKGCKKMLGILNITVSIVVCKSVHSLLGQTKKKILFT